MASEREVPRRAKPDYPPELRARFAGRRFAPVIPEFLDVPGTELVVIAASGHVAAELGVELDPERENLRTAELFTQLALDRREHPIAPLVTGDWA